MSDVLRQLSGIRMLVMTRADWTDARLDDQHDRLKELEAHSGISTR